MNWLFNRLPDKYCKMYVLFMWKVVDAKEKIRALYISFKYRKLREETNRKYLLGYKSKR